MLWLRATWLVIMRSPSSGSIMATARTTFSQCNQFDPAQVIIFYFFTNSAKLDGVK